MIKIGNCPDSWGVWFDKDDTQIEWHQFCQECAGSGYKYIEIGPYGYMPKNPKELNDEFNKWGLVPIAGSIMFDIEDDSKMAAAIELTRKICSLLKDIGAKYFIIMDGMYCDMRSGQMTLPSELDSKGMQNLINNLVTISREAKESGMIPVFHPHAATHVEYEAQIEKVLDGSSPDDVMLCFDTGHHIYCEGNDVYSFVEKHSNRISYLHLKDLVESVKDEVWKKGLSFPVATGMGIFADIGKGQIDFVKLKKILDKVGFDGFAIIEQDCYPIGYSDAFATQKRVGEYLASIEMGLFK